MKVPGIRGETSNIAGSNRSDRGGLGTVTAIAVSRVQLFRSMIEIQGWPAIEITSPPMEREGLFYATRDCVAIATIRKRATSTGDRPDKLDGGNVIGDVRNRPRKSKSIAPTARPAIPRPANADFSLGSAGVLEIIAVCYSRTWVWLVGHWQPKHVRSAPSRPRVCGPVRVT